MKGIKPVDEMLPREKAGVAGIKAGVFLQYGTAGHRLALESARLARELDPNQAEWYLLISSALGKQPVQVKRHVSSYCFSFNKTEKNIMRKF